MIRQGVVVVPAANEEALIGPCLAALRVAADRAPWPVRIVVAVDACTDRTPEIVAAFPGVEAVVSTARMVGHARKVGVEHALEGLDARETWLASTDADSTVPADWLEGMARSADLADVVLGTVVPDTLLPSDIERVWFAQHELHDGHPHVHAANLGIRGDAYLSIGGWCSVSTGEDVDLVERAMAAGLRIRRDASIAVRTSSRPIGRAPQGFSSYLRALGHV